MLRARRNTSSTPPRLPYLSAVLRPLRPSSKIQKDPHRYTIVAVSYRGYWRSHGTPSQKGIEMDAIAALNWVRRRYYQDSNLGMILWGQSIGAGVAAAAGASYQSKEYIRSLILETPFTSIRDMLVALYPQRWLPYRYLWPFLWN